MKAVFCDMYNFKITGDIAPCMNASSCDSPGHSGPSILIVNDQEQPDVYAIEGNVVDRVSAKNGKGWCKNVAPTLNTQDRHAVCIAIEGNGTRPSHMGKGFNDDGTMYTLNTTEVHSVCFVPEQNNCTSYKEGEISATLCTKYHYGNGGDAAIVLEEKDNMKVYAVENHPNDSRCTVDPNGIVQCLSSRMGTGGNNTPFVLIDDDGNELLVCNSSGDGIAAPLDASYFKGQGLRQGIEREYIMMKAYSTGNGQLANSVISDKTVGTLDCMHDQKIVIIENPQQHYYTKQRHDQFVDGNVASSLKSRDYKEFTDIVQEETADRKYILRRLTPTECLRLQGLPDWWCDGADGSDSAIYKMAGNGIAIPCAVDVLGRIAEAMRTNE